MCMEEHLLEDCSDEHNQSYNTFSQLKFITLYKGQTCAHSFLILVVVISKEVKKHILFYEHTFIKEFPTGHYISNYAHRVD